MTSIIQECNIIALLCINRRVNKKHLSPITNPEYAAFADFLEEILWQATQNLAQLRLPLFSPADNLKGRVLAICTGDCCLIPSRVIPKT